MRVQLNPSRWTAVGWADAVSVVVLIVAYAAGILDGSRRGWIVVVLLTVLRRGFDWWWSRRQKSTFPSDSPAP